jgi:hypothetical protein
MRMPMLPATTTPSTTLERGPPARWLRPASAKPPDRRHSHLAQNLRPRVLVKSCAHANRGQSRLLGASKAVPHSERTAPRDWQTTKPIERSHVPTRDRLRSSRGVKTLRTGQGFLEGFECPRPAWRGGHIRSTRPVAGVVSSARQQDRVRTVASAVLVLGMRLNGKPRTRRR